MTQSESTATLCRLSARGYARSQDDIEPNECPATAVLLWPDGAPCWEANMYLARVSEKGRAVGTVNTYASELSVLLKFLWSRGLTCFDVTDDLLKTFTLELKRERDVRTRKQRKRAANHVNRILNRSLALLEFLNGLFITEQPLIGNIGAQVNVTESTQRGPGGRRYRRLEHDAHLPPSVPRDVKPISKNIYVTLLESCILAFRRRHTIDRARALLKLLADSGIRREEATLIKVVDVEKALKHSRNMLSVTTVKAITRPKRKVPVPRVTLLALRDFAKTTRALFCYRLMRRGKIERDPGWLFMNERGKRLTPAAITKTFRILRRAAGVSERATAHMFRHRWITLQLAERLISYEGPFTAEVAATLLTRIASMSGHRNIESMWRYFDVLFEEKDVWVRGDITVEQRYALSAAEREFREIVFELRSSARDHMPVSDALLDKLEVILVEARSALRITTTPKEQLSAHSIGRRLKRLH